MATLESRVESVVAIRLLTVIADRQQSLLQEVRHDARQAQKYGWFDELGDEDR